LSIVMHSCSEDLSLLQHMLGLVPARLYDTQRAAAFLGHGYSTSYQALVNAELGIDVPKGETRSNWLQRPLTAEQISYAALDVAYLVELQQKLSTQLSARNMLGWFEQDCANMLGDVIDETDETLWSVAYKNISSAWKLDAFQLPLLQKLCHWRETTARRRDRPKSWIVKDQELLALATALGTQLQSHPELTPDMVVQANVLNARVASREAARIAEFLNQAIDYKEPAHSRLLEKPLAAADRKLLKACQSLTKNKAAEHSIAPELLARKRQWQALIYNINQGKEDYWPPSMNNWRRDILESDLASILNANKGVGENGEAR
jgi:ribonuclease D